MLGVRNWAEHANVMCVTLQRLTKILGQPNSISVNQQTKYDFAGPRRRNNRLSLMGP